MFIIVLFTYYGIANQSIKNKDFKTCFVPMCKNNNTNSPAKLFFHIPNNEATKKAWFKAAHRAFCTTKTEYYCCQDHFDASIFTYTDIRLV